MEVWHAFINRQGVKVIDSDCFRHLPPHFVHAGVKPAWNSLRWDRLLGHAVSVVRVRGKWELEGPRSLSSRMSHLDRVQEVALVRVEERIETY